MPAFAANSQRPALPGSVPGDAGESGLTAVLVGKPSAAARLNPGFSAA